MRSSWPSRQALRRPWTASASADLGRVRRIETPAAAYIEFCKSTFPNDLDLRGLRIVVDCAHGAASHVAPDVFHELAPRSSPSAFSPTASTSTTRSAPPPRAPIVRSGPGPPRRPRHRPRRRRRPRPHDGRCRRQSLRRRSNCSTPWSGAGPPGQGKRASSGTFDDQSGPGTRPGEAGHSFARPPSATAYVVEMLLEKAGCSAAKIPGTSRPRPPHHRRWIIAALQVLAALREKAGAISPLLGTLRLYPQKLINVQIRPRFSWKDDPASAAQAAVEAELDGGAGPAAGFGDRTAAAGHGGGEDAATVARLAAKACPGGGTPSSRGFSLTGWA